jgi:hypothetical protein
MGSSTASLSVKEMMEDVAAPLRYIKRGAIWVEALRARPTAGRQPSSARSHVP